MFYKIKNVILGSPKAISPSEVQDALSYIDKYWENLKKFTPKDTDNLIGLPNPYLVPAAKKPDTVFDFEEFFYWDSFFMLQAFMQAKDKELTVGMIDNMVFLINKFGMVPNSTSRSLTSRSQPAFLTTLALQAYENFGLSEKWLRNTMRAAEYEYENVWMGIKKPHARQVFEGLSRCYDVNYIHDLAETETGWDMTPRFSRKCLDYLPVCINSLLFKYEKDFASYNKIIGNQRDAKKWAQLAQMRKENMTKYMWSQSKGLFYDYNYVKRQKSSVSSLAAYYTMWSGLATKEQAKKMVKNLVRFETTGGLTCTEGIAANQLLPNAPPMQWAHPNGWAPLHFLVVEGLEKYGYKKEAQKIATKWLNTNLRWFNQHGEFLEKYNVISTNKIAAKGLYPSQEGFGWTNAVFAVFANRYVK